LMSEMKTENSLFRKDWSSWERCSSGKVARLARRRTRTVIMPSLDGNGAFVSAVPGKRVSFYNCCGPVTVSWPSRVSGVGNTELDNSQLVRFRRREYGCRNRW
jgi:hypothetical protein